MCIEPNHIKLVWNNSHLLRSYYGNWKRIQLHNVLCAFAIMELGHAIMFSFFVNCLFSSKKLSFVVNYRIAGKFGEGEGGDFGKFTLLSVWWRKVWWMNRLSHKVIIITTGLDGFSLANHWRLTKFTKLSPHQTFPLYVICRETLV